MIIGAPGVDRELFQAVAENGDPDLLHMEFVTERGDDANGPGVLHLRRDASNNSRASAEQQQKISGYRMRIIGSVVPLIRLPIYLPPDRKRWSRTADCIRRLARRPRRSW
jgi:hypothetical protein